MVAARLGNIDVARLSAIPEQFQAQHEFCFYLHDSMLSMFLELAQRQYPTVTMNFESEADALAFQEQDDPIGYFLENGHRHLAQEMSVGQAMMAIWADFFNFVYEALVALEKRKFVVALSLLRKPFKENLLLETMILVDEASFFKSLEASPAANFGHPAVQDTHRREYFTRAKDIIPFADFVNPEFLHDLIFDVGNRGGLAPLFDKATHLFTNRKQIRTEDLNLNFIFKNPGDNDIYENSYEQIAYVLLYAMFLEIELFRKAGIESDNLSQWYSLTGLGAYSSLFRNGPCPIRRGMNKVLRPMLKCPHCGSSVRINRRGAARFFISQKLTCRRCKHEHEFPLFWLLSKTDWSISDDEAGPHFRESGL
jgi:hypothetical protein